MKRTTLFAIFLPLLAVFAGVFLTAAEDPHQKFKDDDELLLFVNCVLHESGQRKDKMRVSDNCVLSETKENLDEEKLNEGEERDSGGRHNRIEGHIKFYHLQK